MRCQYYQRNVARDGYRGERIRRPRTARGLLALDKEDRWWEDRWLDLIVAFAAPVVIVLALIVARSFP